MSGYPTSSVIADPTGRYPTNACKENNGAWYVDVLKGLQSNPGAVGAHLCGAYLCNRQRARGLLGEQEEPDIPNNDLIRAANKAMKQWVAGLAEG